MIIAVMVIISLVVVLAEIRETCVSGNAIGPSVGRRRRHSALLYGLVVARERYKDRPSV